MAAYHRCRAPPAVENPLNCGRLGEPEPVCRPLAHQALPLKFRPPGIELPLLFYPLTYTGWSRDVSRCLRCRWPLPPREVGYQTLLSGGVALRDHAQPVDLP